MILLKFQRLWHWQSVGAMFKPGWEPDDLPAAVRQSVTRRESLSLALQEASLCFQQRKWVTTLCRVKFPCALNFGRRHQDTDQLPALYRRPLTSSVSVTVSSAFLISPAYTHQCLIEHRWAFITGTAMCKSFPSSLNIFVLFKLPQKL